jgi:hypothetical protein
MKLSARKFAAPRCNFLLNLSPECPDITAHLCWRHAAVPKQTNFGFPSNEKEGKRPGSPTAESARADATESAQHGNTPVARTSLSEGMVVR